MTHEEQVIIQEERDYTITQNIMTNIFTKYNATIKMEKMPLYHAYDATIDVTKGDKFKQYTVEIKERNVPSITDLETLPLKVKKYCNIMSKSGNKTPLVIYLVNGKEFYIYDLKKIDLNEVELRNWYIPITQYTPYKKYDEQPTFFFKKEQAVWNGEIPKYN